MSSTLMKLNKDTETFNQVIADQQLHRKALQKFYTSGNQAPRYQLNNTSMVEPTGTNGL